MQKQLLDPKAHDKSMHFSTSYRYHTIALVTLVLTLFFIGQLATSLEFTQYNLLNRGIAPAIDQFGQDLLKSVWADPRERAFFGIVSLWLFLWSISKALCRVELVTDRLCVRQIWQAVKCVEFRQVIEIYEEGRFGWSIALLYYPILPTGLLDLEDARTLFLPEVRNQETLVNHLRENIPS